jgi:hypothetical protein
LTEQAEETEKNGFGMFSIPAACRRPMVFRHYDKQCQDEGCNLQHDKADKRYQEIAADIGKEIRVCEYDCEYCS